VIPPTVYRLFSQFSSAVLYVRTGGPSVIEPVRAVLAELDPNLPFSEIRTVAEEINASLATEQLTAFLASAFGGLATLISAIGIYALLAYSVTQRKREIAVLIALGARPAQIFVSMGRHALGLITLGILAGAFSAYWTSEAIQSLLYGVTPTDPASLTIVVVFITVVSMIAISVPLMRAIRVQPATILHLEK
jgi:ABC-type antimicrobial peptide transport system permease subunit